MTKALTAALLGSLLLVPAAGSHGTKEGGTFRVSLGDQFDFIDPALAYVPGSVTLLNTTCATLMSYPDKPPPTGYTLVPEVAAAPPRASKDLKTWTFTLRRTFRFSDGTPVQASAFARAIHRTLDPAIESPGALYTSSIVGAEDVLGGRAATARGVVARGNTLTVRFAKPVPDFPAQTTMMFFCAVPPGLPVDPEGVGAFPGSGPYFVKEFRPGERIVIERNPYYRGARPRHVDGFLVDVRPSTVEERLDQVERGETDWGGVGGGAVLDPERGLVKKYGVNKSRLFVMPGLTLSYFALNTSRPLFRNNAALRQAVNYAIDRSAQVVAGQADVTDQHLPFTMPGFRDVSIYPRHPNLERARSLARGNRRGGKANLYVPDLPRIVVQARLLKRDLARIGLDVRIRAIPFAGFSARISRPREPVDIVRSGWTTDYIDPGAVLVPLFDGRFAGSTNYSWLNDPDVNRALRKASTLQGAARYRAFGELDVRLARDDAPAIAVAYGNQATFVSARTGCVIVKPTLDLTAVCLK